MLENSSTIIIQHNLGMFADLAALQAKYPSGRPGDYAGLHSDGNMYYWNGAAWTDTGISYASLVGDSLTFDNTDPSTLGNPPAGKTWLGNFNESLWTKDENGVVSWYATLTQLRQAIAQSPAYWFDGVDDYIRSTSINIFNSQDATVVINGLVINPGITSKEIIFDYGNRIVLAYNDNSQGKFRLQIYDGTNEDTKFTSDLSEYIQDGKAHNLVCVFNRTGGKYQLFIDNVERYNSDVFTVTTSDLNVQNFIVGSSSGFTFPLNGSIGSIVVYNTALTASQVAQFSLNPENIPYELDGASNTALISNGGNEDGALTGWSSGRGTMTTEPTIVHSGTYAVQVVHDNVETTTFIRKYGNYSITAGKKVKFELWVYNVDETDANVAPYIDNVVQMNAIYATKTGQWEKLSGEFIANKSGILDVRMFSTGASAGGGITYWDDVTANLIGEVAAFSASGIGHNTWKEKYGLAATVNGAKPFNLPAHHIESEIIETTSTSPSITPPEGYSVESISIITDENLTAIAAQQSGSLDNLITGKTLDGSVSQASKTYKQIGDHEIFDGTKTINFTLTGNGANGTKIIANYKREE